MEFIGRTGAPTTLDWMRPNAASWRQAACTPTCPMTPRLDGKLAVLTGGNTGIGLEIARGLAARGAELIIAARNAATAGAARDLITKESGTKVELVPLDLTDLRSVVAATTAVEAYLAGRTIDVLVANAGVAPAAYAISAQGHELAFAVNVLGHHVFVRRLATSGRLAQSRLVVMSAEIYPMQSECSSDFRYRTRWGGMMAYSRSKLGNLWFARELAARHPEIEVYSVHPGVIASGIANGGQPIKGGLLDKILLDVVAGAQTPLILATQAGLERGGYYSNKLGLVRLPPTDAAMDTKKSAALWLRLEELGADFL
jgi:NAD(P)-dependent dehydrogenase (short-subunit alcohol dehydrogenase family)